MPTFDAEALVRLDLKPGEILAVIPAVDLTPAQMRECQVYLSSQLAEHGLPSAVVVLPRGSQLAAINARPPLPVARSPRPFNAVGNECCAERGPCGCPPPNPM